MRSTTATRSRLYRKTARVAAASLVIGWVTLGLGGPAAMADEGDVSGAEVSKDADFSWFVGAIKSAFGTAGDDSADEIIPASGGEGDAMNVTPVGIGDDVDPAAMLAVEESAPATVPTGLAEEVQILLSDLGYDVGAIDGVVGPSTMLALEQFQRNQGLPVDGEMSVELLTQLQAVQATAEVQESAPDDIIVASAPSAAPEETPLLEDEPVDEVVHRVSRFEVVGVPLGSGLGTVRRSRPFDQKGTLEIEGMFTLARFGSADGDILRELDVKFGPDERAVWIELSQGNFAIESVPQLIGSLCDRYGATDGCVEDAAEFQCLSESCKRGLTVHEMRWEDEDQRELLATFFTGGSETVVKVILTLSDHGALTRLNDVASQTPVERPGADKLKL